jgi:type IV pilus assembly protein PilO
MKRGKISYLYVIIILLFLVTVGYSWWFIIQPLHKDIDQLEVKLTKVKAEEQKNKIKIEEFTGLNEKEVYQLQQELPPEKYLENFILDLEEVQTKSASVVKSMTFGEKEEVTSGMTIQDYIDDSLENSVEQALGENSSEVVEEEVKQPDTPEGLESVRINLSVESPSYFELYSFLGEIEKLDRIVSVDNISFANSLVSNGTINNDVTLISNITIHIYYFVKMNTIQDLYPEIDKPSPSNKFNPLYPVESELTGRTETNDSAENRDTNVSNKSESNDTSESNDDTKVNKENEQTELVVEETSDIKPIQVLNHRVKAGETLFSIALTYYNSRQGEALIKSYNNLESNTVYSGTIIQIPIYEEQ